MQWVDGIPDATVDNVVSGNVLTPYGNECVDIKEGAAYNIVEDNVCKEQYDDDAGCFGSRGNDNVFRCIFCSRLISSLLPGRRAG